MTDRGHPADDARALGTTTYPQLTGALVLCGWEPEAAAAFVRGRIARAVHEGLAGGSAAHRLLVDEVLEHAPAPPAPRPAADEVEAALADLAWTDRLATVAVTVFGSRHLGDGKPAEVAAALGVSADPWAPPEPGGTDLVSVLRAAVDDRAPAPDPDMLERLQAETARRNRWIALAVTVVLVAILVVAIVAASAMARDRRRDTAEPPVVTADYAITQWVAVLDTGPTPASLAAAARQLGRIVGVHVFTDRWACYEGFAEGGVGDGLPWFLGIGAVEREVVDRLVVDAGVDVLIEAQVRQVCVQPPPTPDVPVLVDGDDG